jgi:hypothetical protein
MKIIYLDKQIDCVTLCGIASYFHHEANCKSVPVHLAALRPI